MAVRVAITGVGIISSAGLTREDFWASALEGRSGISVIAGLDTRGLRAEMGGEIKGFDPARFFNRRQRRRLDRSAQYAIVAAQEALAHSGLRLEEEDPYRVGVVVGTSLGGMTSGDQFHRQWRSRGLRRARPSLLLSYPIQTPCDSVAQFFALKGPRTTISNACAAGLGAVGWARDLVVSGQADVVLAGGVDPLSLLSLAGFNSLQSLTPTACSPYSRSDGLNIGEGAAFLVLETVDRASSRGARILAEVLGYGLSADAYHPTAPDPSGRGAAAAMRRALTQGRVEPHEVSYINGHGTGTPANDQMERRAMRLVFGEHLSNIPISSTKSIIGHTLGAAGAIETAACVLAIERDVAPPTLNIADGAESDLDLVPNRARPHPINVAVSNNYAFGGNNGSLVLAKPGFITREPSFRREEEVFITGVGAVGAPGFGAEAWWAAFAEGRDHIREIQGFDASPYRCRQAAEMPKLTPQGTASPSAWRRMDTLSRQALLSARLAWDDSGLRLGRQELENVALVFATGTGPLETVEAFNRTLIEKGPTAVTPILFPNTVMNAATGHIGMRMGFKGPTITISSGGVSGLLALHQAAEWIRQGEVSVAVVVSSDEFSEALLAGHDCIPGALTTEKVRPFDRAASGTALAGAAVAFVLESGQAAAQRGARRYARILEAGMTGDAYKLGGVHPEGREWAEAMRLALDRSGVRAEEVDYVVAGAYGVPAVDRAEARAISGVFGSRAVVGAPASIVGDTMGSAGPVNVLAAILALQQGILTPTLNLQHPVEESEFQHVRTPGRRLEARHVLVNSRAVGGNYVSLLLRAI